jgi:hypothetical protein
MGQCGRASKESAKYQVGKRAFVDPEVGDTGERRNTAWGSTSEQKGCQTRGINKNTSRYLAFVTVTVTVLPQLTDCQLSEKWGSGWQVVEENVEAFVPIADNIDVMQSSCVKSNEMAEGGDIFLCVTFLTYVDGYT